MKPCGPPNPCAMLRVLQGYVYPQTLGGTSVKNSVVYFNRLRQRSQFNALRKVGHRIFRVWMVASLCAAYVGVYIIATASASAFTAAVFLSVALMRTVIGVAGKYLANMFFDLADVERDAHGALSLDVSEPSPSVKE